MNFFFNRFLIPVDFTVSTNLAIQKALSLAEGTQSVIHLLHVCKASGLHQYFSNKLIRQISPDIEEAAGKLEQIREGILSLRPEIKVVAWATAQSSVEETIIQKAKNINADLIIIGKNSNHFLLPFLITVDPSRVAQKAGIPVLTANTSGMGESIRSIVVPIVNNFPEAKLAAINALKSKFRFQIRLIAFHSSQDDAEIVPSSLLNAYRILKSKPYNRVTYEILYGKYRIKSIISYCTRVNADLLIVNAETETKTGWLKTPISEMLPVNSRTQILAVLNA
jgi:nucleotide-binding universal stress UspA family protein